MVPTVTATTINNDDVRRTLMAIPATLIPNAQLDLYIEDAEALVLSELGDDCTQGEFDRACRYQAAFYAYFFYNVEYELGTGEPRKGSMAFLQRLERMAVMYRLIAQRSTVNSGKPVCILDDEPESTSLVDLW